MTASEIAQPRPVVVLVLETAEADQVAETILDLGYQVRVAGGIQEAVEVVLEKQPAAILTSLALPDGNWRDLVERLRSRAQTLFVVLCAKAGTAELWWDALDNGVAEILISPYLPSELQRVLAGSAGSMREDR